MPLCKEECCYLCKEHNDALAEENRNFDSLKRKFASLHRKKCRTGDPRMPSGVHGAKHTRCSTINCAKMHDAEDTNPIATEANGTFVDDQNTGGTLDIVKS